MLKLAARRHLSTLRISSLQKRESVGYNGPGTGGKVSLYVIILNALFCKTRILLALGT